MCEMCTSREEVMALSDTRTIKVGLYRDLIEVCMLLESVWDQKNVPEIAVAVKKLKEILAQVRKEEK